MMKTTLLQATVDLVDDILRIPIEPTFCIKADNWKDVAFFYLFRSRETLRAISLISADGLYNPANVLVRHLFEFAVRLKYMETDPESRVASFLEHSGVIGEDARNTDQEVQDLMAHGSYAEASKLIFPLSRGWGNLKEMCGELGLLDDYDTMYRHASESAHGGGHGMPLLLLELSGVEKRPEWMLPGVVLGGLEYYHLVLNVSLKVFPDLEPGFDNLLDGGWFDRWLTLKDAVRAAIGRNT